MRPVEFFTWMLPVDGSGGPPSESRYKMTREQAVAYPGAMCLESTREVRMVADDEAERHALGPHHVVAPKPDAR
jgi:hypothetical protein